MEFTKKIIAIFSFLLTGIYSFAQETTPQKSGIDQVLESSGKVYVVVAVVVVILIALFIYLFRLDKKISKLEKEQQK